jgi:hypothetical protein
MGRKEGSGDAHGCLQSGEATAAPFLLDRNVPVTGRTESAGDFSAEAIRQEP